MNTASPAVPLRTFSIWRVALVVVVVGTICALAIQVAANRIVEQTQKNSEQKMLHMFALATPTPRGLDPRLTDADNDLVADPPAEAARRRSPDPLVFTFVAGPTAEEELLDWSDFTEYLARVTGKKVSTTTFTTTQEQLAAMAKGELDVCAFNTGAVPAAVAAAGFVPVGTFGGDDGTFGIKMLFIVPAASTIKTLDDLAGHVITFTSHDSNSGCKAALALLQDHDLLPQRDYSWRFSGGHDESITRLAKGEYEVAPVASDILQRILAAGTVKPEQIRTIYESERFPPATLGYAHDLSDELAANIRKALLEFDPKGTSLAKRFADSQNTHFVPVNYKQDFALIRRIDASFRKPTPGASE